MPRAHRLLILLYAVAALSGQALSIVWMKRVTLILGGTVPAVAAVLAVVLLGYAAGAAAVGRWGRAEADVARLFALLQAVVGAWGLALPPLFGLLESVYAAVAPAADTAGHAAIRIALLLPVLLPPSAAMGAVFPAVSAAGVSRTFAAGVTGSLAGVLAGALLLLPSIGIDASLRRLGGVSLVLSAAALLLPAVRATPGAAPVEPCRRACIQAAALGVALFLAEIVWLQLVYLVVDQTAYAEGLVVAAVFLAMAGGAALALRPRPRLTGILVATALLQLLLVPGMVWLAKGWSGMVRDASFAGFLALEFLLALAVVGPAAAGYGLAVPRVCEGFGPRAVGRIWASHYLGGTATALAAPFLVIPSIGLTATLALASAVLSVPLLMGRRWGPAALVLGASCAALFGDVTFRHRAAGSGERILFHHADGDGLVEVYERVDDGTRTLLTSRRRQEGGDGPEQTEIERLMGRLPLALHAPKREVLVIGLGTGVTAGAMLEDPAIGRLTCVEISSGVLGAVPLFARANGGILASPRARIVLQDGRSFIRLSRERYDLILQELFFAYRAGVGSLYSDAHYRRCRERLAPGGRVAQWISTSQIGPDELRSVVRTFQGVFPHTSLWRVKAYLLLLGGEGPLVPPAAGELRHFVAADAAVASWAAEAPINTEDNLLVEYRAPRLFRWLNSFELMMENLRGLAPVLQEATVLSKDLPARYSRGARGLLAGMLAQAEGDSETARRELRAALESDPENGEARQLLGTLERGR